MIVMAMAGGLGNQMFQYAAGRALSSRLGVSLGLDLGYYNTSGAPGLEQFPRAFKLQSFKIAASIVTSEQAASVRDRFRKNVLLRALASQVRRRFRRFPCGHFLERTANYEPVFAKLPDRTYLAGYFQSPHYFEAIETSIRLELRPVDAAAADYAERYVEARRKGGRDVIAVHVRRGDMTFSAEEIKNTSFIPGPPVTPEYVRSAMRRFDPDSTFLFFSDSDKDLDWCRGQFTANDAHFCYGHTDLQDFAVMRACDHNIISNSSFSWWAAWLNDRPGRRVVRPRMWLYPDRYPDHRIESLVPASWEAN